MATNAQQTLSADGTTSGVKTFGQAAVTLSGDFGSGTAQVQARPPGGEWADIDGLSFTAAAAKLIAFPKGSINELRVSLTSSSAPSLAFWVQSE